MGEPETPGSVPGEALKRATSLLENLEEDQVLAGLEREKEARYGNKPDLGKFFDDALSKSSVFGQKLGSGGFNLGSRLAKDLWTHKGEIAAGAAGGALAKTTARLLLAGSGGWPATLAIGAAGGAVGAGLKEYVRQRGGITIEEAGNKLVIDGLRNEFRRLSAADKKKVFFAAGRGAIGGMAGALISDAIADNEWVQQQFAKISIPKISIPKFEGPSASTPATEATPTGTPTMTPTAEATPAPKPPTPASTPAEAVKPPVAPTGVPAQEQLPAAPPQAAPTVETPQLPVKPQLPPSDTLTIPKGSSIWNEAKNHLENNLDYPPTNTEISNAVNKIMADNNITDARAVPAGANLNIHGVNEMIGKTAPPHIDISPELAKMPEMIQLQVGSDPWKESFKYGSSYLNKPLTNAQTLLITKELCKQSGIAVPVWGLNEGIDHTKLPVGFKLIFNDPVKKLLEELKAA